MKLHRFSYFSNYLIIIFLAKAIFFPTFLYPHDMTTYNFLENQTEPLDQDAFYTPCPQHTPSLLPIFFAAHIIEKISYLFAGYIIVSSGLELKENLNLINGNYYWPFSSFAKFGCYGQCCYTIGVALAKVFLVRYGAKLLIQATCPKELSKKTIKHRYQYQTKQAKIRSI